MRYLFLYAYTCKRQGLFLQTGSGSAEIITESDKITPKVIESAVEITREKLELEGIQIDNIAPMGWFKYDGEDEV